MLIGGLEVGIGHPTRIVAELGTLHHHQGIDGLMLATRDAFNAGADYVKTQFITPRLAWWANTFQRQRYMRLYRLFPKEAWKDYIISANKDYPGRVFASMFDEETIKEFGPLMPAIKIAFIARNKRDLIDSALSLNKPIIISLSNDYTSKRLLSNDIYHRPNILRLWVQSQYPLIDERALLPFFGHVYHGLSVHSNNMSLFAGSMVMGARMIEVHVQGTEASGADTKFALTMDELKRVCGVRGILSSFTPPI